MNILLLGGAKRVAIAGMLIEAGKHLGHDVRIFSYELDDRVPIASVGSVIIGLRWHDPDILKHLHEVVVRESIDIMIPFVDPAIAVVRDYMDTYGDVFAAVSDTEAIDITSDKMRTQRFCTHHGIAMPELYDDQSVIVSSHPFPLIAKPRRGSASAGIRIIDSPQKFDDILPAIDEYVVQAYIANKEEYTVDSYVAASGEIQCTVPRRRMEVLGGEVMRTQTVHDEEIIELSRKTINAIGGLRGPVTLQFIRSLDSGRLMLMEINPRFGGGAVCSVHAGAPLPEFLLREYLGLPVHPVEHWIAGTEIVRYPAEVVFQP